MDETGLTEVIDNADGSQTFYYEDSSQIILRADGSSQYIAPPDGTKYAVNTVTDAYGITTTTFNDGSQLFVRPDGIPISLQEAAAYANTIIRQKATTVAQANGGIVNADGSINFGNILTPAQKSQIISQLGNIGGQWLARQVNGQTVFYRGNSGLLGSLNIKDLLIPGAIVAALFLSN